MSCHILFINSHGLVEPNAQCDPGYYCEFGMDRGRPTGNDSCVLPGDQTGRGDICPLGSYCPLGTTLPLPCPAGSFSNETGLEECHVCPAGFYCLEGMCMLLVVMVSVSVSGLVSVSVNYNHNH